MTKEMIAAVAEAVAKLAQSRIERLDHIRDQMLKSISSEREQLANLEKGAEGEDLDSLLDEDHFLFVTEETVGGLLVVGLYCAVEHFTKQLLRHRYAPDKVTQCYKIEYLQETLARDCDFNLAGMPGFDAINELRSKNNQVKHGEPIVGEPAVAVYERLRPAVVPYLERLALVVLPG